MVSGVRWVCEMRMCLFSKSCFLSAAQVAMTAEIKARMPHNPCKHNSLMPCVGLVFPLPTSGNMASQCLGVNAGPMPMLFPKVRLMCHVGRIPSCVSLHGYLCDVCRVCMFTCIIGLACQRNYCFLPPPSLSLSLSLTSVMI